MIRTRQDGTAEDYYMAGVQRGSEVMANLTLSIVAHIRSMLPVCFVPGDAYTANLLLDDLEGAIIEHLADVTP